MLCLNGVVRLIAVAALIGDGMAQAVFFDVDGTLLSHATEEVPASARKAVAELRRRGIPVGLATGRSIEELRDLPLEGLAFDMLLTLNGQLVLDGDGGYVAGNPLVGEALESVLSLFASREVPVLLVQMSRMYINYVDEAVIAAQRDIHTPVPEIGEYDGGDVYQAILYVDDEGAERLRDRLPGCDVTRWHERALDVNARSAGGKADGVARWCEAQGVSMADVVAFGDAENDVTMLEAAGIGVAMGNATPEAKAAADIVTDDIDADGVWNALVRLGIL